MDAAERSLLAATVHDAVAAAADGGAATLDAALSDLGWLDMLAAETDVALDVVFHALGRTNGNATVLDDVLAGALGVQPRPDLAVLLPPFGSWAPPGTVDGGGIRAVGITSARVATADTLLVVCGAGTGHVAARVPVSACAVTPVRGIDPDLRCNVVRIDVPAEDGRLLPSAAWDSAVARARRAGAHQTAGAARTMLDLAREHAVEREQFGRPVARFQAVRHRLADALVAVEALDAALVAAADEPRPETAELAKAIAGRTARTVAAHCQQVLAGIGFTTDHPFHRFLKRTIVLDGQLGSADSLVLAVGRRLLASRHVPTLIEL